MQVNKPSPESLRNIRGGRQGPRASELSDSFERGCEVVDCLEWFPGLCCRYIVPEVSLMPLLEFEPIPTPLTKGGMKPTSQTPFPQFLDSVVPRNSQFFQLNGSSDTLGELVHRPGQAS